MDTNETIIPFEPLEMANGHNSVWAEIHEKSTRYGKIELPIQDKIIFPVSSVSLAVALLNTKNWIAIYATKLEGHDAPIIWMQKHSGERCQITFQ